MAVWALFFAVLSLPVLLVVGLWWAHLRFWRVRLHRPMTYALEQEIELPDGGTIELRRVCLPRAAPVDECPVLMIHGLAMNHRNHDHAEDASLARYLSAQGRDVWLLTLRSGRSRPSLFGPRHSAFAAMVEHDLPSAVARVLALTGATRVDVAGFSMGGMLLYASLGRSLAPALVRRALLIGAPARIRNLGLLSLARLPAGLTPSVPMRLWTRSIAAAPAILSPLLRRRLYNPRNMTVEMERSTLWNAWEDIPGRLGADFVGWSSRGGTLTVHGEPVLEGLAKVDVPACFFAGAVDWLAPPETVRAGYDAWGRDVACEKHFVLLGRGTGAREDYGHCDLSFGRHARDEVFAPAARFLASGKLELPARSTEVAAELPLYAGRGTPGVPA